MHHSTIAWLPILAAWINATTRHPTLPKPKSAGRARQGADTDPTFSKMPSWDTPAACKASDDGHLHRDLVRFPCLIVVHKLATSGLHMFPAY